MAWMTEMIGGCGGGFFFGWGQGGGASVVIGQGWHRGEDQRENRGE